jgi:hypothetical protein
MLPRIIDPPGSSVINSITYGQIAWTAALMTLRRNVADLFPNVPPARIISIRAIYINLMPAATFSAGSQAAGVLFQCHWVGDTLAAAVSNTPVGVPNFLNRVRPTRYSIPFVVPENFSAIQAGDTNNGISMYFDSPGFISGNQLFVDWRIEAYACLYPQPLS